MLKDPEIDKPVGACVKVMLGSVLITIVILVWVAYVWLLGSVLSHWLRIGLGDMIPHMVIYNN